MKTEKQILLFDGHRGVYIPQNFAEECTTNWHNVSDDDRKTLLNGPDDEWYWEAWNTVLDNAYYQEPNGPKYNLYQDDDCWAILEGYYINESGQLTKSMPEEKLDSLNNALVEFRDAYNRLRNVLYDFDGDFISEDYPFKESFDEIEVNKWIETSLKRVRDAY